jgi:CRISPR-associated endonuclease/helicase Cas3
MDFYAHSDPQAPDDPKQWEPLHGPDSHLERVQEYIHQFCTDTFRCMPGGREAWTQLGNLCAGWHDLGKFSDEFQTYLHKVGSDSHDGEMRGKVDHTSAGAQFAMNALPAPLNVMAAYVIAGHHAGLLNGIDSQRASLLSRLNKDDLPRWRENVPPELLQAPSLAVPKISAATKNEAAFQLGFATRMLFSCLVDADFLATESFMSPERAAERPTATPDFKALDAHLIDYLAQRFKCAEGTVATARAEVLSACRKKAEGRPGLYELTVPTGGGKTLSSLAFALRHCTENGLDRVIYAIPFTSIIEQTAEVFRGVFDAYPLDTDELILEHHSNFDPDKETTRTRLTSENWDSPLIVTTNVQLFESLFAKKTSRCRKLHRIANSVIILDEAQTLPITLLKPCLQALQLLVEQYGCTVVLCTATQPAIEKRNGFDIGLAAPISIIEDAPALYRNLKRVKVDNAGVLDCDQLSALIKGYEQGLAIVNTRRHAATLYQALNERTGGEGCYHLSAAMTPEHRSQKLAQIRQRLKDDQPCRVVSTQLIEAGVDVDFPVVWRALAGLDSVAQAAGRCNREGKRAESITWIFQPQEEEYARLFGTLKTEANATSQIIGCERYDDLLGLDAIEHYFQLHYWSRKQDWDKQDICDAFRFGDKSLPLNADFTTVAEKFRFIDSAQRSIVVGWDDKSCELIDEFRRRDKLGIYPDRKLTRRLQRQTVTVSQRLWEQASQPGKQQIEILCDRFAVLTSPDLYYHPELGLMLEAEPLYDPITLISD